jgi:hypothetical protein
MGRGQKSNGSSLRCIKHVRLNVKTFMLHIMFKYRESLRAVGISMFKYRESLRAVGISLETQLNRICFRRSPTRVHLSVDVYISGHLAAQVTSSLNSRVIITECFVADSRSKRERERERDKEDR